MEQWLGYLRKFFSNFLEQIRTLPLILFLFLPFRSTHLPKQEAQKLIIPSQQSDAPLLLDMGILRPPLQLQHPISFPRLVAYLQLYHSRGSRFRARDSHDHHFLRDYSAWCGYSAMVGKCGCLQYCCEFYFDRFGEF